MSNIRSGGKVFDRCMENYFQCTRDMPTEHDFSPVYGPLCGIVGSLCAHTAVERREFPTSSVAKSIEAKWFRMGGDLGSGNDPACAMRTLTVALRSAFSNGWDWEVQLKRVRF